MLKGYEGQQQQVSQVAAQPTVAAQQATKQLEGLTQRLEQFKDFKFKQLADETTEAAKQDAFTDSINGEPFHRESVTTVYGQAYNSVASATYASSADISINEKSTQLAIEHRGNPVGYDMSMKEYVSGLSKEAPTPELQSVINISGNKLRTSTFGKMSIVENEELRQHSIEVFGQEWDLNLNQIVGLHNEGQDADAELLKTKNIAHLTSMKNAALITDATAASLIKDAKFKITYGTDMHAMQNYIETEGLPASKELLEAKLSVSRPDMDIAENKKYDADLTKLYTDAVKTAKADVSNQKKVAKKVIKEATTVLNNNKTPDNLIEVRDALSMLPEEDTRDFKMRVDAQKIIDGFGELSLAQKREKFNEYKKTTVAGRGDVEVENKLEKILAEQEARANSDVVGLAMEQSVINELEMPMGVEGGVHGLIAGLEQMKVDTARIQEEYGSQYTNLMSKADAKGWSDWFDNPEIGTVDKLAMIDAIAENHPDVSNNVFRQIGGKQAGMFTFAATLSTSGNSRAAEISMMGAKSGAVLEESFKSTLSTHIGNAFAGYQGVYENMVTGISNYSKGTVTQTDAGGVGVSPTDATVASIGEIVSYNSQKTVIPVGVSKREFENSLDKISIPGRPNLEKGLRDMTDYTFNGDYQLRYAGAGKYYVRVTGDNPKMVTDKDGSLFVIEYGKDF